VDVGKELQKMEYDPVNCDLLHVTSSCDST